MLYSESRHDHRKEYLATNDQLMCGKMNDFEKLHQCLQTVASIRDLGCNGK